MNKEPKKPKTSDFKGKRYRCAVCRKRAPRRVLEALYFCPKCVEKNNV